MAPIDVEDSSPATLGVHTAAVRRTPLYLECRGQPVFAWLHAPADAPAGPGVVLCPGLGYEQVYGHRTLRHLADALARAGLVALRLDPHGTGDSAGGDEDPDRLDAWRDSIAMALGWLRDRLDGQPVSLFGLRLGASLALQVACSVPVDGLALWAPVVAGRALVRELKTLGRTAPVGRGSAAAGDLEAGGFVFTRQTVEALGRLDLLACRPQCRRILLASRDDLPGDGRLAERLTEQGCQPETMVIAGYADVLAEPTEARLPQQAIDQTVAWLRGGTDSPPGAEGQPWEAGPVRTEAILAVPAGEADPVPVRERALWLGADQKLFGILSEPAASAVAERPVVLMINAGLAYHAGPGRLYVALARHLAARGFRSVRLDLGGLGETPPADGERENEPYPRTAFRDVAGALESLERDLGARSVVLLGLCSGAYVAFQSAVHLRSPLLRESLVLNPLTFYWRDGKVLDADAVRQSLFHYYWYAAFDPSKWLRLLSGRSKISLLGAVRLVWQRLLWRPRVAKSATMVSPETMSSHPPEGSLSGDLEQAVQTGRRLTFVFSRTDPGYSVLTFQAGRKLARLHGVGKLDLHFIDDADHTFSTREPRGRLADRLAEILERRYAGRS